LTTDDTISTTTQAHYELLLAPIYRWMLGDFAAAVRRSAAELQAFGIVTAGPGATALDLGAGPGLHSLPLSEAGYRVTAIDSSASLLAELQAARSDVTCVALDLRDLNTLAPASYDVIVCMGDTLTQLGSEADVERLIGEACTKLALGGTLVFTFRDYASRVRESTERFILVRADADRILTCCLDYDVDRVRVTDIVHERGSAGWTMRASEYQKLRLSAGWVRARIEASGATVTRLDATEGRIAIVARRLA
jgi:SAM-dependent methyltransferase